MPDRSPTVEGFRAVFRRPSLILAEITWRWTFGFAASALLAFTLWEFLRTLPITTGDMIFLRSRQPVLISEAIAHIFRGSGRRLVESALVVAPALSVLWILVASLGRAATLQALSAYFREEEDAEKPADVGSPLRFWRSPSDPWRLRSLTGISFLRVTLALAAVIGVLGAALLAGFASSRTDPEPALVLVLFLALSFLVAIAWSGWNWFLSLAPVFVTADGQDTFGSINAAADFCRSRSGPVLWSSTAFGLLHLALFVIASSAVFTPMLFASVLPGKITVAAMVLLTMVYFAAVDVLHVGRLAAYVCILEDSRRLPAMTLSVGSALPGEFTLAPFAVPQPQLAAPVPGSPSLFPPIAPSDDDILSDIPGLVPPPETSPG